LTVLIIAYLAVFGAILMTLWQLTSISGGFGILDFDQGYTKQRVAEVFESYGERGFSLYSRIQLLDIFNPALYSLIAAAFTYLAWRGRGVDWLCLAPFLGGIGDYAENVTLYLLATGYPDLSDGLVSASSTLSLIKNTLLIIGMLPLLIGLAWRGVERLQRS